MPRDIPGNLPINNSSPLSFSSPVAITPHFSLITLPRQAIIEKVKVVSTVVFSKAQNIPREHPKIFLASLTATGLLGGAYIFYLYRKQNQPLFPAKELAKIQAYINSGQDREAKMYVEKKVHAFLLSNRIVAQLGEKSKNSLKAHLSEKIYEVSSMEGALESSQIKMIESILSNFSSLISQIKKRVDIDSRQEKLEYLGIAGGETLREMVALGKETHCKGKIPFKLIFSNGQELIYKPRSMLPERLLCDKREGLLKNFGFGTYKVLDCEDEEGGPDCFYGYCEVLENVPDNNTIDSREELLIYFKKLCVLEKIAERLGLSDLHYLNIITSNKSPHLIDAEVFLIPDFEKAGSGIFSPADGAAFHFDVSHGRNPSWRGLNRLVFTDSYRKEILEKAERDELSQKEDRDELARLFDYEITEEHLKLAEIDVEDLLGRIDISEECEEGVYEERIEEIRQTLEEKRGRFILLRTTSLTTLSPRVDPAQENTMKAFLDAMKDAVEKQQFTFHDDNLDQIREQARVDFFNRDIPVFYYDSQTSCLYYQDVLIGSRSLQESTSA
ncbi:DUF4135 domain-containing protein [Parachlamydia sp. AcF125]|uniref:DUF4135 domain-containing protein n=1 Tax=Parachlamydia sp. AcF125 TaxID=2795736 RepID=UPI001BCA235C|nr:DUF4135 domain-containing protein [Parachlamydia sp. AcF125]MBS4167615.1 hypothetical protein [Parachlamydia sp. AcF125]